MYVCKYKKKGLCLLVPSLLCLSYSSASAQLPLGATVALPRPTPAAARPNSIASLRSPVLAQATPPPFSPKDLVPERPVQPLPEAPPTPLPTPSLETSPQLPSQPPSPAIESQVKIKRVDVLGSTVFSDEELAEAVTPFLEKSATFEQLLAIRTAVTELYTRNGYTTSGAFLPPQDISNGVIKIQVVEGELERIEIQGLERLQNSYVRSRINLATQTPLNIRRLESALQLLQLNPLLSRVQAELTAGTAPGRSVLILNLREAFPLNSAIVLDNRDSPSVGSERFSVALSHNNLLGLGDRLDGEVGLTEGVTRYSAGYEIPVNARDGTFRLRYDNGNSSVIEQPFADLDINGNTQTYSLGFRQPLIRTPTQEFALSLSGDLRRSETFLFGDEPFSFSPGPENGESRVSVLRFAQDWVDRSPNRVLAARSQFSLGLDVLGATVNDTGTDGRFFSWVGQFQWVQAIAQDTTFIARIGTQLTPDSLLPLEQFSIGGVETVRGYRQNQRVADNGVVGSAEVRFPIVRDPDGFGLIQLTPFLDVGTVWDNNGEIAGSNALASIGLGLRWQLGSRFLGRLDYGIPLISIDRQGDSLQDNGIFFSLLVQPF